MTDDSSVVTIRYRNYKGVVAIRRIRPIRLWFGTTDWHSTPQWLLEAVDIDKDALRDFALRDVLEFDAEPACI